MTKGIFIFAPGVVDPFAYNVGVSLDQVDFQGFYAEIYGKKGVSKIETYAPRLLIDSFHEPKDYETIEKGARSMGSDFYNYGVLLDYKDIDLRINGTAIAMMLEVMRECVYNNRMASVQLVGLDEEFLPLIRMLKHYKVSTKLIQLEISKYIPNKKLAWPCKVVLRNKKYLEKFIGVSISDRYISRRARTNGLIGSRTKDRSPLSTSFRPVKKVRVYVDYSNWRGVLMKEGLNLKTFHHKKFFQEKTGYKNIEILFFYPTANYLRKGRKKDTLREFIEKEVNVLRNFGTVLPSGYLLWVDSSGKIKEKGVDGAVALHVIDDLHKKTCDHAYVVSSDLDMLPLAQGDTYGGRVTFLIHDSVLSSRYWKDADIPSPHKYEKYKIQ